MMCKWVKEKLKGYLLSNRSSWDRPCTHLKLNDSTQIKGINKIQLKLNPW